MTRRGGVSPAAGTTPQQWSEERFDHRRPAGRTTGRWRSAAPALVGILIGTVYAVRLLASAGWDATVFLQVGEGSEPEVAAYVEDLLQHPVHLVPGLGHDGRFFFVHAVDPWLADTDNLDRLLDRPRYRAGRILYPALAGGLGLLPAGTVVWMLPAVNVLMMGLGTLGTALLAQRHGLSPWFGLAFALNPGMLAELVVSGSGIVAMACLMWAVVTAIDRRLMLAGWAMAGAVLARETMAVSLVGLAIWLLLRERRLSARLLMPSVLLAGGWRAWVTVHLGEGAGSVTGIVTAPFKGLQDAISVWGQEGAWLDALVAGSLIALVVWMAIEATRCRCAVPWAVAGFLVLMPLMTAQIWLEFWDITRAVAPVTTAAALLLAARVSGRNPSAGLTTDA